MKKPSSILIIFVIVIIAFFAVWKVGTPNLISKNKENTTEKVSKKVKKESKKTLIMIPLLVMELLISM